MNDDVKHAAFPLLQLEGQRDGALASSSDICQAGPREIQAAVVPAAVVPAAVEHASDSFMITAVELDPLGPSIVYVNPAFTRMTGYAANDVIGRTARFLEGPATSRRVLDRMRACLSAGTPFHGEAINYRKDGAMFDVEWRMDPIRDSAGETTHWVSILRDVTEKNALARVVHEQQRELQRTAILRMLAQIAEDTIHESLQPLYAIGNLGAACRNAILNQGLEIESEKILGWLDSILAGVNDAKVSATRLRSIAQGSEPRRKTVRLDDVIESALDALAQDFECGEVSLHTELKCQSTVEVDSAQIRYVLVNLVQNASEAIRSSTANTGNIKLRSWSKGGFCHVTVEDDGPGFEDETLADVFNAFYSTKPDRLGLGLAFSRAIINAHGGDIFAERVASGGFRVGFTIPVVQAPNND